jgi:hypothetical protein
MQDVPSSRTLSSFYMQHILYPDNMSPEVFGHIKTGTGKPRADGRTLGIGDKHPSPNYEEARNCLVLH